MTDIELALRELDVDWPATPDIAAVVSARIAAEPAPGRARRPWRGFAARPRRTRLAIAVAAFLLLLSGGTLAVPEARSTVLRWLGIESVEIRREEPRPVPGATLNLGTPVTLEALRAKGVPVLTADDLGAPGVYETALSDGTLAASLVYEGPILVQTFKARVTPFIEKTIGTAADVERLTVDGAPAFWITGSHGFAYTTANDTQFEGQRLADRTLLVERADGTLLRIEGALSREQALEIARSIK